MKLKDEIIEDFYDTAPVLCGQNDYLMGCTLLVMSEIAKHVTVEDRRDLWYCAMSRGGIDIFMRFFSSYRDMVSRPDEAMLCERLVGVFTLQKNVVAYLPDKDTGPTIWVLDPKKAMPTTLAAAVETEARVERET